MGIMKKSDLKYTYKFSHTSEDDPKITGEPDSSELNRQEGYEVLYFINQYAIKRKLTTVAKCQRVEKLIHEDLPGAKRSRLHITQWLNVQLI